MSNPVFDTNAGIFENPSRARTPPVDRSSQLCDSGYLTFVKGANEDRKLSFKSPEINHFWNKIPFWSYFGTTALVGVLSALFTKNKDYYDSLVKPSFAPTSKTFPIIWGFIYLLIATTTYLADVEAMNTKIQKTLRIIFGIQITLNLIWNYLFFGLKNPSWALSALVLLIIAAGLQMFVMFKINKVLGVLFGLYLLALVFLLIMNLQVTTNNVAKITVTKNEVA